MHFSDFYGVYAYTHGRAVSAMVGAGAFRPFVKADDRHGCRALIINFFHSIYPWVVALGPSGRRRAYEAGEGWG